VLDCKHRENAQQREKYRPSIGPGESGEFWRKVRPSLFVPEQNQRIKRSSHPWHETRRPEQPPLLQILATQANYQSPTRENADESCYKRDNN